jgi:hypothetical protein
MWIDDIVQVNRGYASILCRERNLEREQRRTAEGFYQKMPLTSLTSSYPAVMGQGYVSGATWRIFHSSSLVGETWQCGRPYRKGRREYFCCWPLSGFTGLIAFT